MESSSSVEDSFPSGVGGNGVGGRVVGEGRPPVGPHLAVKEVFAKMVNVSHFMMMTPWDYGW